ncbi:hypothetical protein BaRGS_00020215 [Batillaria attramentaria]|uniref:Uncharacterized protein n=1 Tax=Batillaria attramentaria TaxID=370345 RepID=A0ABD0KNI7_9CAEN
MLSMRQTANEINFDKEVIANSCFTNLQATRSHSIYSDSISLDLLDDILNKASVRPSGQLQTWAEGTVGHSEDES